MGLLERANNLLKANVNHLMDKAEDPEVMIKQLIRDMDEAVGELRRETVNAVAREKQLKNKVKAAGQRTADLEKKAALALDHDNEELARKILGVGRPPQAGRVDPPQAFRRGANADSGSRSPLGRRRQRGLGTHR
jgi:hypothetical protein